jgi:hypothetical protein
MGWVMSKWIAAAVLLVWAVGCAGLKNQRANDGEDGEVAEADVAGAPPPNGKMVCRDEYPTGSHIPERICKYQDQLDQEALQSQMDRYSAPNKQMLPGN